MRRTLIAVPEPVDAPLADLAEELGLPTRSAGAPRLLIGRREWLALPDLGVFPLHTKTDSGAFGSSLHAEQITLSDDKRLVRFTTEDDRGRVIQCEAAVTRFGRVRNSSGVVEKRIFIETTAMLSGGFRWTIQLSLARRSEMTSPMLLGRRALAGYFLIDPAGTNLLGNRRSLDKEMRAQPA